MLPILLRLQDGCLAVLHDLTCLFEVFLALSSHENNLFMFIPQPVDLLLHVREPQLAHRQTTEEMKQAI